MGDSTLDMDITLISEFDSCDTGAMVRDGVERQRLAVVPRPRVILTVLVWRSQPPASKARRVVALLLVLTVAQGGIGYVQYFTGLPEILVGLHMVAAAALTAGAARVPLALRTRAEQVRVEDSAHA